jgi:hypothetical protein
MCFVLISPSHLCEHTVVMGHRGSDAEEVVNPVRLCLSAFELDSLVWGVQCQLSIYDVHGYSKCFSLLLERGSSGSTRLFPANWKHSWSPQLILTWLHLIGLNNLVNTCFKFACSLNC